jgi:hypothetical protein
MDYGNVSYLPNGASFNGGTIGWTTDYFKDQNAFAVSMEFTLQAVDNVGYLFGSTNQG